jgi:hypothetical protein
LIQVGSSELLQFCLNVLYGAVHSMYLHDCLQGRKFTLLWDGEGLSIAWLLIVLRV